MTSRNPDAAERLRRILDALAEDAANLPDAAVFEDAHDEGEDPTAIAAHLRTLALDTVRTASQEKLRSARDAYVQERARLGARRSALPATADERRQLLAATLRTTPSLREALTLAARDLAGVPDEDVESLLRQLDALGAFDGTGGEGEP